MRDNKTKKTVLGFFVGLSLIACSLFGGQNGETSTQTQNPFSPVTTVYVAALTNQADQSEPQSLSTSTPTLSGFFEDSPTDGSEKIFEDVSQPTPDSTLEPTTTPSPTFIPAATITPIMLDFPEAEAALTPANTRPGPSVEAVYLNTSPNIDGDIGDWELPMYGMENVVYGSGYYANERDLFGEFKVGWDNQFLYIGVIVRDTMFVQETSGSLLWGGDSVEILLDTDVFGDYTDDQLSSDDFQIGISSGNLKDAPVPNAFLWAPRESARELVTVLAAGRLTEDGYMLELALPWVEVGVTPSGGQHFGFVFSIYDNDAVDQVIQRSVISFAPERLLYDPTTWRDLVLKSP